VANNTIDERRGYYRINDTVGLVYTVCQTDNEIPTEEEFIAEVPDEFQLINHLSRIDMESSSLLHSIHETSPEISRYIKIINAKIEAIARQVVSIGLTDEIQSYNVTLSAGGISFLSPEKIELDKTIRSQMILYPSCSGILTYGKVVRCNPVVEHSTEQFDIALEYSHITETDRDALVRHVLQLQSNQLRQKK